MRNITLSSLTTLALLMVIMMVSISACGVRRDLRLPDDEPGEKTSPVLPPQQQLQQQQQISGMGDGSFRL